MENEYPTDEQLTKIREWPTDSYDSLVALAEYICSIWHWGEPWCQLTGKKLKILNLSTGGWSGNENIIAAIHDNTMFQMLCWQESRRGGHYRYKIRPWK